MRTLHHLVRELKTYSKSCNHEDVLYLISQITGCEGEDWRDYINGPGNVPVFQNAHLRLALIYWEGYSKSKKHGHPEGGCLLKVLSGTLVESRFDPINPQKLTGRHHFSTGDVSYIHDSLAYHVVENPTGTPAISLHLYSPGIYTSRAIQQDTLTING